MSDEPQYITLEEARGILRVTQRQVYRLAAEGRISTLQTQRGRLYSREDVVRIAQERGVNNAGAVMQSGSDNAQARQVAALLRQQADVLTRLEQRPTDPNLVERLERIESKITAVSERPAPTGPPRWFYVVLAIAAVLVAVGVLAIAFLR